MFIRLATGCIAAYQCAEPSVIPLSYKGALFNHILKNKILGSVDLDTINDLEQRFALEVQIGEFGQVPKQLFTSPHPMRLPPITPDPEMKSRLSIVNIFSSVTITTIPILNILIAQIYFNIFASVASEVTYAEL